MNSGRDSLDIEANETVGMNPFRRRSETRELLVEIVKLLPKALILALRLCGEMVGATISNSNVSDARDAGRITQEGQCSTDTSDGDTAVEEEEKEQEETSSEGFVAAIDER